MDLAVRLRAEASRADERRLLVVTGAAAATRAAARDGLAATDIGPAETAAVTPTDAFGCECLDRADPLLGTTREAVVYDCHGRCEPNDLGKLAGVVDGGGLLVLLTPPLGEWPERTDDFDRSLAVPPFDEGDVGSAFRTRLAETIRAHRGIAVVRATGDGVVVEQEGLTDPPPRPPRPAPRHPAEHAFPAAAYDACLTQDQVDAVEALEALQTAGNAVVVEADRGRGKSSAAGIAAASLAAEDAEVLVTAPTPDSTAALFDRAEELLDALEVEYETAAGPHIETAGGSIRYEPPAVAAEMAGDTESVIVDEAAALPVRTLESLLAAEAVAFSTTIHGYEGAGRGFSVRFRDRLAESDFAVTEHSLAEPIRYAPGDPIEVWSFRALALGARPPVDRLVEDATPETVTHRELSTADLLADEHLLREVFGLLVLAHYRTEPNDLARLLDAPNVTVQALCHDGHVVSVALLAREGNLPAALRSDIYEGARVRGNLVPDVLTGQLRDEAGGVPVGWRVLRIATHASARSRGLGSELLSRVRADARGRELDYLGVAYGATPELLAFWDENDFETVHISTTRNDRSGEHSAIMLQPLSEAGKALHERHTEWFHRRLLGALRETLGEVEPAVVIAALQATGGTPSLDLSPREWRHVAGIPFGMAIFETAPSPVRRLCYRHIAAPAEAVLSARQRRLLVRKFLQGQQWERIREAEGFHGRASCLRATGAALEPLVELYGTETARAELERHR